MSAEAVAWSSTGSMTEVLQLKFVMSKNLISTRKRTMALRGVARGNTNFCTNLSYQRSTMQTYLVQALMYTWAKTVAPGSVATGSMKFYWQYKFTMTRTLMSFSFSFSSPKTIFSGGVAYDSITFYSTNLPCQELRFHCEQRRWHYVAYDSIKFYWECKFAMSRTLRGQGQGR